MTPGGATFWTVDGETVTRGEEYVYWDIEAAEKGGFETFMLKEIYEQPDAIEETIGDRIRHGRLELEGLGLDDEEIRNLRRTVIVAAGRRITPASSPATRSRSGRASRSSTTSRAVALPQPRALEGHARHRHHPIGETADTLAAMRLACGRARARSPSRT